MLFQTPEFALLFLVTLTAFYLITRKFRLHVLAASSLIFYAASGMLDFLLLATTIGISYLLVKRVEREGSRTPIYAGTVLLLISLAYFKYGEFAYSSLRDLLGGSQWIDRPEMLATILPLGISFYTFQILGYLIDLRAGRAEHPRSLVEFTVFVTFFGQLIAGPIMRAKDYLPQLKILNGATKSDIKIGGMLILEGLVKKVVLADLIAQRVDQRFAAESFTQPEALIASGLFAFQIYFDFSGYVDIALGLGRMFGIKLTQNFRTPYLSGSPTEFWTRWHITLSNWIRDYMYIPLGGNRRGRIREITNIVFVMAVAGLWHGAGWTFVLWGLIHGVYIAVHRFVPTDQIVAIIPAPVRYRKNIYKIFGIAAFFFLTTLAWIPFRAESFSAVAEMYSAIFTFEGFTGWISQIKWIVVLGGLYFLHALEWWVKSHKETASTIWGKAPPIARGSTYAMALLLVIIFSGSQLTFIYFRF